MKALHVQTFCCEGVMDWIHGGGSYVDGIFVPEKNLLIRYKNETAYVAEGKLEEFTSSSVELNRQYLPQVIKEVEISDNTILAACTLIAARNAFTNSVADLWRELGF